MTTINSGSGNAGTPRSMNRKGGSERKQAKRRWEYAQHHDVGRTGKPHHAPVPVAIFSSYSSTFETEQKKAERQRKALAEEEQYLIGGAMA